jgi:hypothetical protein
MENLNTLLGRDDATAWDHLLVIGAGDGRRSPGWANLPARRRDLVEANPQRAALLVTAVAHSGSTRVWPDVIATCTGPATWHRYNLDGLDGAFDADDLREVYPRLVSRDRQTVEAVSLADFVCRLDREPAAEGLRLLWLDVPGARRLIETAAPHAALRAFTSVVLHDPLDPLDGSDTAELDAALDAAGFDVGQSEQGWRAYHVDAARLARRAIEEKLHRSQQQAADLARQLAASEEQSTRAHSAQAAQRREAETAEQALRDAVSAAVQARDATQRSLDEANERAARWEAQVVGLDEAIRQAQASRDDATRQSLDALERVTRLDAELIRLQQAFDAATRHAEQQLADAESRLQAAQSEIEASHASWTAADAARATADRDRQTAQAQGAVLQERARQLEKQLADAESAVQALTRDKQTLTTERDTAQKSLQEKTKRVQVLENEVADTRHRLGVMSQEIGRAEGQLEVLKELFLQEASL